MTALGVDVGGTFTDVALWDGTRLTTAKVPTTPDQSEGVVTGAVEAQRRRRRGGAADRDVASFLHGTTAATNALLERAGARVALVADDGFTDIIEIGRQDRPSLYDSFADRATPLVDPARRFGLGSLDATRDLRDAEAVAVSLLRSYADPSGEREVGDAIRTAHPGLPLSLSSDVAPEFREFERTSTAVLNAYLMPVVASYLSRLVERSTDADLPGRIGVMRSSGGLIAASDAARLPASILLSGPAGGVTAAAAVGEALGRRHLVSFDMGGTSTDVCRIENGAPAVDYRRSIEGYPCLMPALAIHTVGAGGGSMAWVDDGGSLRVGPQSAGAVPGPAAYGKGGDAPTVTDANVLLRRINPDARLGGEVVLDISAARAALATVGDRVGLDAIHAASGVVTVVEEVMAAAIRKVSVEQGADPRRATLVAFGGAGGLHATALAKRLDMAGVIVPPHAGVFSALGLLLSAPRVDAAQTVMLSASAADRLPPAMDIVGERARTGLEVAVGGSEVTIAHLVDVRYLGQSHEIAVPFEPGAPWAELESRFHDLHRQRNGFARPGDPIEAVTVRAVATGRPALRWAELPEMVGAGDAERSPMSVVGTDGNEVRAAVWWRPGLRPGAEVIGPAVIEEPEATTYLDHGDRAVVAPGGALEVEW